MEFDNNENNDIELNNDYNNIYDFVANEIRELELKKKINNLYNKMTNMIDKITPEEINSESEKANPNTYLQNNLDKINWIKEFISDCNFNFTRIDIETELKYIDVIYDLKNITKQYFEIKENIDYYSLDYLYNPEYFFDTIFYCRGQYKFWFTKYNEGIELLKQFEIMIYTIYNYNNEINFEAN